MNEEELTISATAEMLSVSTQTIRRLIKDGLLDARRKTFAKQSHYLIKRVSVEEYLKRLETQPE